MWQISRLKINNFIHVCMQKYNAILIYFYDIIRQNMGKYSVKTEFR